MPSREPPQRAARVGPQRPVCCDASAEVLTRYVDALHRWEPPIEDITHTAASRQTLSARGPL
jgi:hypothetical protein